MLCTYSSSQHLGGIYLVHPTFVCRRSRLGCSARRDGPAPTGQWPGDKLGGRTNKLTRRHAAPRHGSRIVSLHRWPITARKVFRAGGVLQAAALKEAEGGEGFDGGGGDVGIIAGW